MSKNQLVFISEANDIRTEDGGQAKIATLYPVEHEENGVFIRLQSWCEGGKEHPEFDALIKPGKQYIVHIEEVQ
jgi:hypothetical protein